MTDADKVMLKKPVQTVGVVKEMTLTPLELESFTHKRRAKSGVTPYVGARTVGRRHGRPVTAVEFGIRGTF